jgi:hypothetical protein
MACIPGCASDWYKWLEVTGAADEREEDSHGMSFLALESSWFNAKA